MLVISPISCTSSVLDPCDRLKTYTIFFVFSLTCSHMKKRVFCRLLKATELKLFDATSSLPFDKAQQTFQQSQPTLVMDEPEAGPSIV